jgi:hypothetical protein
LSCGNPAGINIDTIWRAFIRYLVLGGGQEPKGLVSSNLWVPLSTLGYP